MNIGTESEESRGNPHSPLRQNRVWWSECARTSAVSTSCDGARERDGRLLGGGIGRGQEIPPAPSVRILQGVHSRPCSGAWLG